MEVNRIKPVWLLWCHHMVVLHMKAAGLPTSSSASSFADEDFGEDRTWRLWVSGRENAELPGEAESAAPEGQVSWLVSVVLHVTYFNPKPFEEKADLTKRSRRGHGGAVEANVQHSWGFRTSDTQSDELQMPPTPHPTPGVLLFPELQISCIQTAVEPKEQFKSEIFRFSL